MNHALAATAVVSWALVVFGIGALSLEWTKTRSVPVGDGPEYLVWQEKAGESVQMPLR